LDILPFIIEISKAAGEITLAESGSSSGLNKDGLQFKSAKDLVTNTDREVEEYIVSEIQKKFPEHSIWGEETGKTESGSEYTWIIDPIDGTTSFVHNQPFYSISIALHRDDEPIAAVVYAPKLGELFSASKGGGAFLNGERIFVSEADELINSVLGTGFACLRADMKDNNLRFFNKILPKIRGVRRYGSAAVDMAYVAAGRFDGFWEMNLNLYDIAAGHLLVTEAGGQVLDFESGLNFPKKGIIATNGKITKELIDCMKEPVKQNVKNCR